MKTILQALFLLLATSVISVSAATFVVDTAADTIDANPGNGICADASANCSLRAAISEANALAGADVITLGAVTYTQSLTAPDDNVNAGGDWDITSQTTINGAGSGITIVQAAASPGAATERVFEVVTGALTLTNMTVRHGRLNSPGLVAGGGIANSGTLSLNNVIVRDNQANSLEGGAIGGGIYNGGTSLTLTNTTVTANSVSASIPGSGFGGGVGSSTTLLSTINITGSSVSGNSLSSLQLPVSGGGLYLGGIFSLTAVGSHFDNNTATSPQISEGGGARLVSIVGPSTFNISNCTFNDNTAVSTGSRAAGGGLHLYTSAMGATLTGALNFVSIDRNRTQGNATSRGGGLYVNPISAAINMDVMYSSISQNANNGARGGGIELSDRLSTTAANSTVNITNTTISSNSVGTGAGGVQGAGGGVHVEMTTGPLTVNFNFVTVSHNLAFNSGGGIHHVPGNSTVNLKNSIVAHNGAGDIAGAMTSQNFNHIWDLNGGIFAPAANDTSGFDPQLGPLQNNGGPTQTRMLAQTSPLVNAIPNGVNGCGTDIIYDQRFILRPLMTRCEIGAVELEEFTGGPFTISGTVMTDTGIPLRNITVMLIGGDLPQPIFAFTSSLGIFQFTNVPANAYTISVQSKKYLFEIDGIFLNVTQDLNVNFSGVPRVERAPFDTKGLKISQKPQKP